MQSFHREIILSGLFILLLTDGIFPERNCSYQDIVDHLNLSENKDLYSMTRPVKNYKRPTDVSLEVLLYAILDVVEKEQKFIPYVWTVMRWHNEYISWDPQQFCGINNVSLPSKYFWQPDLAIEEMTEKDRAPPSPYLTVNDKGDVEIQDDMVLVSTCRMTIYKFPFDIQRCNLTFKSVIHTVKDIRLQAADNSTEATEWSREVMRTQYEWLFLNMAVTTINATNLLDQDNIVYTITMERRSTLYIVNFLLPVLFYLCLDLASFMISDARGEKLCYQVTVLLAVTVLQLILNEILPASSNRIPLIAVYCIGIFGLMFLSLLKTILVMYLMNKDSSSQEDKDQTQGSIIHANANVDNHLVEAHKWTPYSIFGVSPSETPSELHSLAKEESSSSGKPMDDFHALVKLSEELQETRKTLSLLLQNMRGEGKSGYWTRVAERLNRAFLIFYVTVIALFLIVIFYIWKSE